MALLLSGDDQGFPLASAIDNILHSTESNNLLKIGTPYLSASGLEVITSAGRMVRSTPKVWLIGLHQAITEPAALRTVLKMDRSEARIFTVHGSIAAREMTARPIFHAKVVGIEHNSEEGSSLQAVIVSSANLTGAALGNAGLGNNYEAGACFLVSDLAEKAKWSTWWDSAWSHGLPLTQNIISHYERLRERFLKDNKVLLDFVDPPSAGLLSSAPSLWIEAGAMSGGSRNQIEFNRELAEFFGPPALSTRKLCIRVGDRVWDDRSLTPKTTSFGVEIWRLSLPTKTTGGFNYVGEMINLQRSPVDDNTFILDVASIASLAAQSWRTTASRRGYIGRTSGKREYGLY